MSSLFSAAARRALRFSLPLPIVSKCGPCPRFSPSLIANQLAAASATISTTAAATTPRFFSSGTRVSADERLKRLLQAEILHAEASDEVEKEILAPKDFPFEIVDNSGEQMITLKRNVFGENIEVEVHMPDLAEEEEEEEEETEEDDDNADDANKDADVIYVPLTVKIDKGGDTYLEFTCTSCSDGITINSMFLKSHQVSPDTQEYKGPKFEDLDENLQRAVLKYLEVRRIDNSLSEFLEKYMVSKDDREYLDWLKNIKDFVTV